MSTVKVIREVKRCDKTSNRRGIKKIAENIEKLR